MLIKDDIINNPFKNSYFLEESISTPDLVPVVSNSRLGLNLVRYEDLNESGFTLQDVAESNGLDYDSLAVVINEGTMIEEPELATKFNYVIEPVSEDSYEAKLVKYYCNLCEETMDESVLDNILLEALDDLYDFNDSRIRMTPAQKRDLAKRVINVASNVMDFGNINQYRKDLENTPYKNTKKYYEYIFDNPNMRYSKMSTLNNKKNEKEMDDLLASQSGDEQYKFTKGLIGEGEAYLKDMSAMVPKSKIGKLIAKLRNAYHGFLLKSERANNMKKAGFFRKIAAKILTIIDKLAAKLQRFAG